MTLWLPDLDLGPDQAPEAAQLVAFVEDQVRIDAAPLVTLAGLALIDSVAAWTAVTPNDSAMPASIQHRRVNIRGALGWREVRFGMGIF
jgi:hypothetical protein